MTKKVKGIRFSHQIPDQKIAEIMQADDDKDLQAFKKAKGKLRISTMLDTDIIEELKRRANEDGDGRYQTYLNQFLRSALFEAEGGIDKDEVTKIVRSLVKASALKQKRA